MIDADTVGSFFFRSRLILPLGNLFPRNHLIIGLKRFYFILLLQLLFKPNLSSSALQHLLMLLPFEFQANTLKCNYPLTAPLLDSPV